MKNDIHLRPDERKWRNMDNTYGQMLLDRLGKTRAINTKLLEALEALLASFRDNPHNGEDWKYLFEDEMFVAAVPKARAAIKQAKGI